VPKKPLDELLPPDAIASQPLPLPELSEPEVVRHFVNLSTKNMSADTNFYPLGSCTMKYNPKRNERLAAQPGMADLHPYQPESTVQGMLALLHQAQHMLAEIAGLPAVSLQPAAGAQGEMAALLVAAAYFRDRREKRTTVLIPDAAHGTNPASAAMAGFAALSVKSSKDGFVDLDDLAAKLNRETAVFMITNPNTLGLFEPNIAQIARRVHDAGGLVYLDGANMNAILGITRPGDFGADLMHFNPHKTFSGPHGGGGPGAGPIAVTAALAPFLPTPIVVKRGDGYHLDFDRPKSIGRVRAFFGNVGVLVRMFCYIRSHGPDGLRRIAEDAVLNANYLLSQVKRAIPVPHGDRCLHEFVASAAKLKTERDVSAMDLAKRLLDYGFHAPTVYFPLIVREAMMIEPTETESKATLDAFARALNEIVGESVEILHEAPHRTPICRPDEVAAARKPVLRWRPGE
jgi:glycine dehydrogenase subunit 2